MKLNKTDKKYKNTAIQKDPIHQISDFIFFNFKNNIKKKDILHKKLKLKKPTKSKNPKVFRKKIEKKIKRETKTIVQTVLKIGIE